MTRVIGMTNVFSVVRENGVPRLTETYNVYGYDRNNCMQRITTVGGSKSSITALFDNITPPMSYVPKKHDMVIPDDKHYIPDLSKFRKTARYCDRRIVYMFVGTGKNHVAYLLSGKMAVADDCGFSDEIICEDVVVVDEPHRIKDVIPRLFGDPIVRIVEFS